MYQNILPKLIMFLRKKIYKKLFSIYSISFILFYLFKWESIYFNLLSINFVLFSFAFVVQPSKEINTQHNNILDEIRDTKRQFDEQNTKSINMLQVTYKIIQKVFDAMKSQ